MASVGLNALTGIDGIWTALAVAGGIKNAFGLNALTGIDGIWTYITGERHGKGCVLMPLRALMGFGPEGICPG